MVEKSHHLRAASVNVPVITDDTNDAAIATSALYYMQGNASLEKAIEEYEMIEAEFGDDEEGEWGRVATNPIIVWEVQHPRFLLQA